MDVPDCLPVSPVLTFSAPNKALGEGAGPPFQCVSERADVDRTGEKELEDHPLTLPSNAYVVEDTPSNVVSIKRACLATSALTDLCPAAKPSEVVTMPSPAENSILGALIVEPPLSTIPVSVVAEPFPTTTPPLSSQPSVVEARPPTPTLLLHPTPNLSIDTSIHAAGTSPPSPTFEELAVDSATLENEILAAKREIRQAKRERILRNNAMRAELGLLREQLAAFSRSRGKEAAASASHGDEGAREVMSDGGSTVDEENE